MQKITPCLWFDDRLEEAIEFYTSVFPDSRIVEMNRQGDQLFTAWFQLAGTEFMGLNGGPIFTFTEAISFFITCDTQAEVDDYWQKLLAGGGTESQCGWLKDRYGLSWQVVPKRLGELLNDPDVATADRVMLAMLKMVKIDIAELERAAAA
jgi:predicted 3-demethylubiquinone-9 3-methyltransferase (glyoxalase superfamily)